MLDELLSNGLIYDCELYRNCLVVTFYSMKAKKHRVYKWFNETNEVRDMLILIKNRVLCGYNNWNYDNAIIDYLLDKSTCTLLELWEFSQTIINGKRNPYRYDSQLRSYDLLEVMRAGYATISLKGAGVNLKHPKIQDLPIPFEAEITEEQLDLLISYNINDVDITLKVLEYLKPRLEMRQLLSDSYKLNLHSLSDSGIGKELFSKTYIDRVKEKNGKVNANSIKYNRTPRTSVKFIDVIDSNITFITPQLQEYLEELKQIVLGSDNNVAEVIYEELTRVEEF